MIDYIANHNFTRWLHTWVKARLNINKPTGLILTVGVSIAALSLLGFAAIAEDVVFKEAFVTFDQNVLNYVPQIRNGWLTPIFRLFTTLASSEVLIALLLVLGVASWRRQKALLITFSAALGTVFVTSTILKLAVGRVRPAQALSLVHEGSFSFPSGHTLAGTVMYGLLGYLLFRLSTSYYARFIVLLAAPTVILLIGCSRIYLGAHFPSDVLASLFFGAFLLSVFITAVETNERFHLRPSLVLKPDVVRPIILALLFALIISISLAQKVTPFYRSGIIIKSPTTLSLENK